LQLELNAARFVVYLLWFADNLCALKINVMLIEYQHLVRSQNVKGVTGLVVVRRRRFEETGRAVLDYSRRNNRCSNVTARVKQFIEKGEMMLDNPEAVGIYLLTSGIFRYLHTIADTMFGSINLSHDLLMRIGDLGGNLYSFDMGNRTMWIDLESPSYADRNQVSITKILSQMNKFVENS
jgi:mannose-1-phosphate guanylyltransferase